MTSKQAQIWGAVIGAVGVAVGAGAPPLVNRIINPPQPITFSAVIMRSDANEAKRFAIKDVDVTYQGGGVERHQKTDQSGFVIIPFGSSINPGTLVELKFRHPCYQEFDETIAPTNVPYTLYLWPAAPEHGATCADPTITAISLTFRKTYLTKSTTFQVPNRGTVRCRRQPCSPDGKWQAVIVSASLDAGSGNTFAQGSVTCIAGPCPFSEIVNDGFSKGGPTISASIRNWSDTVTYVLRGELGGGPTSPVTVAGRTFDFSVSHSDLPNLQITAQTSAGQSLVSDIAVGTIPWATCQTNELTSTINYHCTLRPDYRFSLHLHLRGLFFRLER
jgi:hypothetical protein